MKGLTTRGQTSLDFLMTYGWALLIIFIVVGVMFALGIFNVGAFIGPRVTGFNQLNVVAWNIDSAGNLKFKLQNYAGMDIRVVKVEALNEGSSYTYNINNVSIPNGMVSGIIPVGVISGLTAGTYYTLPLRITYTDPSGFAYTETGTFTGKSS